ncbi:MAG TPA: IPT/TIG domain-containing protein [Solirubrobacteraceae bacterium]
MLADHPTVYYRLDETEFTTAEDSSGNGLNATYVDSGAGPYESRSGALVGDSDSAVQRYQNSGFCGPCVGMLAQSGNTLPAGNSPRTFEAWINEGGQPRYWSYNLFEYGDVAGGHGFTVNVGGEPRSTITVSGATQSVHVVVPGGLEDSTWHLIDVTYDGGGVGIYADGTLIGGGSIGDAETVTPGQGLKIDGGSGTFGLDEVATYPSALSPERIDAHWTVGQSYPGQPACAATPISPYASAVLANAPDAYYRLDELAAHLAERVAFDSSGHCANATYVDSGGGKAATGPVLGDSGAAVSRYLNSLFGSVSSGEILEQSANVLPAGNSPRTFEAWINEEGQPRYGSYNLFEYGDVAGGHRFTVNVGGEPRSTITVSGATQSVHAVAPGGLEGAGWKLVDVTYDGNVGEIYIDGQLIGGGEIGNAETVSPGEGLKINGASGTFGLDEIAIYPTALSSAAILTHWKAASEAPAGSSIIAGEAAIGGVGGAEGARIQACPTTGGACQVDPRAVESSGRFHMLVPDGTDTVTIFPPAGLKDAQRIFGPIGLPPSVLNLNVTFSPPGGLPEGVAVSSPGRGTQESVVPGLNWGEPSTVTDTACKNGVGITSIAGTNTNTGQAETISAPLLENPTSSGTYQAAIRPLAPVHGGATGTDLIDCPAKLGLVPSGGPPSGGTTVLLNAPGGLTGATAVNFGTTPASSFTVLTDNFIVATAPPGSGDVAVTVTGSGGNTISIGTYTYLQVASLSVGSGPAAGGTTVTITGQGFQSGDQVVFGLLPSPSVTYISSTQLQVVTPPGVGTVGVQVVQGNSVSAPTNTALYINQGGPPGTSSLNQSTTSPQAYAQDMSEACAVPVGGVTLVEQDAQLCGAAQFAKDVYEEALGPTGDLVGAVADPFVQFLKGYFAYGLTDTFASGAKLANLIEFGLEVWDGVWEAKFMIDLGNDACKILVGTDCRWDFWNLFIDPSGAIVDTQGNPISGATATLLEQPLAADPFTPVAPSSGVIEPAENPEATKASGQFDWNALAGTYEVEASAPGCHAPGEESQPNVFTSPFVLPPPAVGLTLTLECAGGTAPTPKVTGLSTSEGATAGGSMVDILGEGLTDVTSVHFGANASVHVQSLSPYAVAAVAPAGTNGTVDVTVSGPGGTSATSEIDHYTYSVPVVTEKSPVIESVGPNNGPLSGGTVVTIKGSHLDGAFSVDFGGTASTQVAPISENELQAVAPAAAFAERVDVTVTTSSGGSAPTLADSFTYGSPPPPVATSVTLTPSPNPVTPGQTVELTATATPTDGGGAVAFYADGSSTPISGCGAQTLSLAGARYQATCSTTGLAVGSHTLSATYFGDASYAGSSGSTNLSVSSSPESTGGRSTTGGGNPNPQIGTGTKTATSTAASGSVSLAGSTISVQGSGVAVVKFTCTGTSTCSGKLTLTARRTTKKGKKKHTNTHTIGTTTFSISAGKTATIKITLNAIGRELLSAAHGHLNATLTILKSSPSPAVTQTATVHLALQKATKTKKGKK